MKTHTKLIIILAVFTICACNRASLPFGKPIIDLPTATPINPSSAPEQDTLSLTQQVPSTSGWYIKNCLQVSQGLPQEVILDGYVVTQANDTDKVVFFPSNELFEGEIENIANMLGISPDGKWLVYQSDKIFGDSLIIEGFSWTTNARWTRQIQEIPHDKSAWASWLDNERLVFNSYLEDPIVVNVFNGETENVHIRYTEFYLDDRQYPLLSRDLNRMIARRSLPEEPLSIVLWDLPSRREIQRFYIDQESVLRVLMRVSPNGEQIAVSGSLDFFYDALFHDIFLTDWDGNVKQLTTFRKSGLTQSLIEQFQWSPDGRYLAFWLNESLAVYDTATQVVTDYCIRSSYSMSFSPYWSPNSHQIVFNGYDVQTGSGPIIVVDVHNDSAIEIQENNYFVIGWMSDAR